MPMPHQVIERVIQLARQQKANPGLLFLDRNKHPNNEGGEEEDEPDENDDDENENEGYDEKISESELDNGEAESESGPNTNDEVSDDESVDT